MGLFSRRWSRAPRDQQETSGPAETDDRSMNRRSVSLMGARGRTKEIIASSAHSNSAPSSPRRFFSHSRTRSSTHKSYTTDPAAPPLPQPIPSEPEDIPLPPKNPRRNSNNASSRPQQIAVMDQQKPLERDPPSIYYADSGYGSNGSFTPGHSRAPSELTHLDDSKQSLPRSDGSLLPDLKLGEDSFSQSFTLPQEDFSPRAEDSYFMQPPAKAGRDGSVSPIDLDSELKPARPSRPSSYVSKRTRFENTPEMPTLDQLQDFHCAPVTNPAKGKAASRSTDLTGNDLATYTEATTTAPSAGDGFSLDQPLPPLSILEGFKVNKKGRILDEEGDPIGELVEGDLLDCVRQKVNARGEVIDDYGRVVGTVRTISRDAAGPTWSEDSRTQGRSVPPAQLNRPEPLRSVLAVRTYSTPSLPVSRQVADVKRSTQPNIPSPVVESPQSPRYGQLEDNSASSTGDVSPVDQTQSNAVVQEPLPSDQSSTHAGSASRDFASQEQPKRPNMSKTQSERSLSDLSKPWARPNMSSVPENDVADESTPPSSPGLYSFKGEIPADDRPQREARSRSPHMAINAKAALAMGHPNSAMLGSSSSGPYSHGNRMGSRRATTHFAGSYASNTLSIALPSRPYRPSPLSSQETSPKRSDGEDSMSEDGRAYYRAPSIAPSVHSVTTISKPRTYFTHAGKITVDPNAPIPVKPAESKQAASAPKETTATEKKKRHLSFGRKTVAK